jgi:hypothetical protein
VLGALAVLVCAGGGYWYYKNRSTSPQLKETALVEGSQAPATPSAPLSQQSDVPEGPPTPAPNTEGTITATSQLDGDAKRRAEEQYAKWKADYLREDGILEYAPSNVLIRAVFEDRSDVAEIAIGKGADVNASDGIPDASSPLVFDAPSIMMLELLYSKGAALNGRNYLGQGLLHRYREPEMVEFVLAKSGLDLSEDKNGKTALALAREERENVASTIDNLEAGNSKSDRASLEFRKRELGKLDAKIALLQRAGAT